MKIDPKLLTATGKKKVKKILSECGPPDYSGLAWSDFQKVEDYYKFLSEWHTHVVLREIFDGSGVEENEDYDCGFDNLSYNEVTIYTNIAKIIIGLRNQIEDAAQTAGGVSRRLDGDWDWIKVTHLLLEGPDGRTYIARKAELSNVPWAYDRESWLVTEFNHGTNPPTDWWIEESRVQWVGLTYDNLDKFTILAAHSD